MGEIWRRRSTVTLLKMIYGRQGHTGPRERKTIGFETIRGGDIVGDHTVLFAGEGDASRSRTGLTPARILQLAHRAAVVHGRAPGLYDMHDVLGCLTRYSAYRSFAYALRRSDASSGGLGR